MLLLHTMRDAQQSIQSGICSVSSVSDGHQQFRTAIFNQCAVVSIDLPFKLVD